MVRKYIEIIAGNRQIHCAQMNKIKIEMKNSQ